MKMNENNEDMEETEVHRLEGIVKELKNSITILEDEIDELQDELDVSNSRNTELEDVYSGIMYEHNILTFVSNIDTNIWKMNTETVQEIQNAINNSYHSTFLE